MTRFFILLNFEAHLQQKNKNILIVASRIMTAATRSNSMLQLLIFVRT